MTQPPPDGVPTDPGAPAIAEPSLAPGRLLDDRYELIERLGAGGGGAVWRANDRELGEPVALKVVDPGGRVERWRREVALARRVAHPNVCRVFDLGEAGDLRFVTMEWVAGESLRSVISGGPPGPAAADALIRQLVAGVAAIHAAGVIHRDLKPENVVVERGGRVVIVDFGLARRPGPASGAPRVTRSGAVVGTPSYMAPEQAMGRDTDARTDVYALGLVIHELCTGELPGEAPTAPERPAAKSDPSQPERRAAPPERWAQVIEACLQLDPADRPADGRAVLALVDGGVEPRLRRWRTLVAAGGIAALATATAVLAGRAGGGAERADSADAAVVAPPPAELDAPLRERQLTFTEPESQPTSAAVTAAGDAVIYAAGESLVRLPIGGRGEPRSLGTAKEITGRSAAVAVAGIFPDGAVAAVSRDRRGRWSLWKVGAGEPRELFAADARITAALSPDGETAAVAVASRGIVAVSVTAGAVDRTLATARIGEALGGLAWSPAGDALVFSRRAGDDRLERAERDGSPPRVLLRRPRGTFGEMTDHPVAWIAERRLVYAERDARGSALLEIDPTEDAPSPRERASWPGQRVGRVGWGGDRLVIARGPAPRTVAIGKISKPRRYVYGVERAGVGRRLAGWTPGGGLVFSVDDGVRYRIVAAEGDRTIAVAADPGDDLFAEAVAAGAVLYRRPEGAGAEIWRRDLGGDGDARIAAAGSDALVRCAGDRAPPCVIAERDGAAVVIARFDPESGERGEALHRIAGGARRPLDVAVSPDGADLAIVDGGDGIVTVSGGAVERTAVGRGAALVSVAWSASGDSVLVAAERYRTRRFSLLRVTSEGDVLEVEKSAHRRYGRAIESADGQRVALETRDDDLDLWLIEGL